MPSWMIAACMLHAYMPCHGIPRCIYSVLFDHLPSRGFFPPCAMCSIFVTEMQRDAVLTSHHADDQSFGEYIGPGRFPDSRICGIPKEQLLCLPGLTVDPHRLPRFSRYASFDWLEGSPVGSQSLAGEHTRLACSLAID
ncbi:hypothetical protein F4820DRAFT_297341 [Hypoxylon rubiginosum]|uniref:Uncharacterized protein n=1 Tax=Hypoxylon rubiginosum TaxID=110542 RepID=A0ACB9Z1S9_9PEZI|nr:hypothetical protein F4820DRAFT_297341 [Hypoxylon rubiginosum]